MFCHTPKKDYLRRLLQEPLPVESHLDHALAEHMNAEVVNKTVESKQVRLRCREGKLSLADCGRLLETMSCASSMPCASCALPDFT